MQNANTHDLSAQDRITQPYPLDALVVIDHNDRISPGPSLGAGPG